MNTKEQLLEGLRTLGEVLTEQDLHFDLVLIGGGALLLRDLITRPTQDVDIVATIDNGRWKMASKPLPKPLVSAIRQVGEALDLPHEPRDDKDWLNPGPTFLLELGLPDGFRDRVDVRTFGTLTVRVAARQDLIALKLWSATDAARGTRRPVDIDDLKALSPTHEEMREAIRWCANKDGRSDFVETDMRPVLKQLDIDPSEVEP